jgi:hypothetical protein
MACVSGTLFAWLYRYIDSQATMPLKDHALAAENAQLGGGGRQHLTELSYMEPSAKELDSMEQKAKNTQGLTRRDVAKAGAAAPLLMSLLSRPAWGAGVCSVSALASGNASGRKEKECTGNGCPPEFWKNNLDAWASTIFSPGRQATNDNGETVDEWTTEGGNTFSSVFGYEPESGSGGADGSPTLLDVLLDQEAVGFSNSVDAHLVAALLNAAKSSSVFGADTTQIIELARAVRMGTAYQGRVIEPFEFFDLLQRMNGAGECMLGSQVQCGPGYVQYQDSCIPSCKAGYRYDVNLRQCVLLDNWDENNTGVDD